MTEQERTLLNNFLNNLSEVRGIQKDAEADALIREATARQPDAAYLLVQRALLLEQALNGAKARVADLQQQLETARGGSFLNGGSAPAYYGWNTPLAPAAQPSGSAPASAPRSGLFAGGASGFLGTAAAMAAGTVAGSFLFDGIEGLLHHNGAPYAGDMGLGGDTTVINNYYDGADGPAQAQGGGDFLSADYDQGDDTFYGGDDGSSFI